MCNRSKMIANFLGCLRVVSWVLAFVGLIWPSLVFVGLHWPVVRLASLRLTYLRLVYIWHNTVKYEKFHHKPSLVFFGLHWASVAFIDQWLDSPFWGWPLWGWPIFDRIQQNMRNLEFWIHHKPMLRTAILWISRSISVDCFRWFFFIKSIAAGIIAHSCNLARIGTFLVLVDCYKEYTALIID